MQTKAIPLTPCSCCFMQHICSSQVLAIRYDEEDAINRRNQLLQPANIIINLMKHCKLENYRNDQLRPSKLFTTELSSLKICESVD